MGYRYYLPIAHKWRNQKESFNGTKDHRLPPKPLSGIEILEEVQDLDRIILTKTYGKKSKTLHENRGDNWNTKSIFFELS